MGQSLSQNQKSWGFFCQAESRIHFRVLGYKKIPILVAICLFDEDRATVSAKLLPIWTSYATRGLERLTFSAGPQYLSPTS